MIAEFFRERFRREKQAQIESAKVYLFRSCFVYHVLQERRVSAENDAGVVRSKTAQRVEYLLLIDARGQDGQIRSAIAYLRKRTISKQPSDPYPHAERDDDERRFFPMLFPHAKKKLVGKRKIERRAGRAGCRRINKGFFDGPVPDELFQGILTEVVRFARFRHALEIGKGLYLCGINFMFFEEILICGHAQRSGTEKPECGFLAHAAPVRALFLAHKAQNSFRFSPTGMLVNHMRRV